MKKMPLVTALKGLVTYWLVNLLVISLGSLLILFIGLPIAVYILKGEISLIPTADIIYSTIQFVLIAASISGTALWIKQELLENHD